MNQTTTVLSAIIEFLLGKKYYANIISTRGIDRNEISSFIFRSRTEAAAHRDRLATTASYLWIETVSFRSRKNY